MAQAHIKNANILCVCLFLFFSFSFVPSFPSKLWKFIVVSIVLHHLEQRFSLTLKRIPTNESRALDKNNSQIHIDRVQGEKKWWGKKNEFKKKNVNRMHWYANRIAHFNTRKKICDTSLNEDRRRLDAPKVHIVHRYNKLSSYKSLYFRFILRQNIKTSSI